MPQEKRTRIVIKKGTRVGVPNGMWMKGKRGEIITLVTDTEMLLVTATNWSVPEKTRKAAWEALKNGEGL